MEAELRTLLYTSLKAFLGTQDFPAFMPNDDDDEGSDAPKEDQYSTVSVLPVTPLTHICEGATHNWLVQINLYARRGHGEVGTMRVIDALRTQYPAGYNFPGATQAFTVSGQVSAVAKGSIEGAGSRFFTPVQFRITATS